MLRERYIDIMEKTVAVYTEEQIREYIESVRKDGLAEHGFPRLASDVGVLLAHGRVPHLRELFVELMDLCAQEMPVARRKYDRPAVANDFTIKEVILCLLALEENKTFPQEQIDGWKAAIASCDPHAVYTMVASNPPQNLHNWAAFVATSEQMRVYAGLNGDAAFVDNQIASQLWAFDENGMYRDPNEPFVYDLTTRFQMAFALYHGYNGSNSKALADFLELGANQTPLMQSVTGEIPFGGRSNQFLHNEAFFAGLFEYEARMHMKHGDVEKARRCKGAAALAAEAIFRYLDTEHMYHIKNGYHFSEGYGCEGYGYFNKYMVTVASMIYMAYVLADDSIEPLPAVAEVGGFIHSTSQHFHKTFVNFGGYFLEYDTNADFDYDCNALGRIHKKGVSSFACMSVPVPPTPAHYKLDIENPGPMSICGGLVKDGKPLFACEKGTQFELVSQCVTDEAAKLCWRETLADGSVITEECTVTENGVTLRYSGEGEIIAELPAIVTDGYRTSTLTLDGKNATVAYSGSLCRYEASAPLTLNDAVYANRNGHYRTFTAQAKDALEIRIVLENA